MKPSGEYDKLSKVMQKYINRLMVGSLEIIESIYGKDGKEYSEARAKILRIGNDQKRDVVEYLENYVAKTEYTMLMEFKQNEEQSS